MARPRTDWLLVAVGAVTNFFDALGIGSFATTTALYKLVPRLRRSVPDRLIPGTLNVGHAPPAILQAIIFITVIAVDVRTLAGMVVAATAGAWIGAGHVARWPKRTVQMVMGVALLAAAAAMTMTQLALFPAGGEALGVTGARLAVAIGVSLLLGALMTMGIGFYAPCMILVTLLGMSPRTAFPIMTGACAALMPAASVRFMRASAYESRAALGLTIGGIPAVLVAAFAVKSLPLGALRWLVVVVVLYTAVMLLTAAAGQRRFVEVVTSPKR
ncbi:MAG: sulfite exporter TauE/SafE family protein [Gemmatimonadaceae bacterium]